MGAVKEAFINNCPYRERFDDYGRASGTTNSIYQTGAIASSKYPETTPWDGSKIANVSKVLGLNTSGGLC